MQGLPQYRSPEKRTRKPQIVGQIQCNPVFDAALYEDWHYFHVLQRGWPDCFNELAACLRKVTSDFPSTRTIPCALSIPVSGKHPRLSVASFSTASSGIFITGSIRLISGDITYTFDRDQSGQRRDMGGDDNLTVRLACQCQQRFISII